MERINEWRKSNERKSLTVPLLCCCFCSCFCYFSWSDFLFSHTHRENKTKPKQNEKRNATRLDSTRLGESRRCTYLCKRLPYLAILSKSVTINSMMCTEIMRQAAINFRFIDHGLSSLSFPRSAHTIHTAYIHSLFPFPDFHRSSFSFSCLFLSRFWNFLFPVYISDRITHK